MHEKKQQKIALNIIIFFQKLIHLSQVYIGVKFMWLKLKGKNKIIRAPLVQVSQIIIGSRIFSP